MGLGGRWLLPLGEAKQGGPVAACQPQHSSSGWGTPHPPGLGEAMPGGHSSCPLGPPEAWLRPRPNRPELSVQACLSVHNLGPTRRPALAQAQGVPFPGWRPLPRAGPLLSARY